MAIPGNMRRMPVICSDLLKSDRPGKVKKSRPRTTIALSCEIAKE